MKRQFALIGLVLAISAVGFFGSRASGGGGGCFDAVKTRTGTEVDIKDLCFDATVAIVEPGDTVTWTNRDQEPHNIGIVSTVWVSRTLKFQDAVSYRFEKPGVYPYVCYVHTGMSGAVLVGDPQVGATRRGEVGTAMGYVRAGDAKKANDEGVEPVAQEELPSEDVVPAAAEDGGQAFYVFLILVGALLMVGVIFLALNRKGDRNKSGGPDAR
jgi:plastocyanin